MRYGRAVFGISLILVILLTLVHNHPLPMPVYWRLAVVYRAPIKEKVVALTFDDGPHPTFTPEILAILKQKQVKATFFMIGKEMEKYPEVVRQVVRQGHVIGNHTYTHPSNIEADTQGQVRRELEQCEKVIERMTGKRSHLFRPPKGLMDGAVFNTATEEGYRVILWTVCADHHDAPTPELMARRVLKHIRPGGIILVHDGTSNSRKKDVAATPLIIDELTKLGYRFVTVPELLRYSDNRPAK